MKCFAHSSPMRVKERVDCAVIILFYFISKCNLPTRKTAQSARLFIYIADEDCEDNLPSKHGCTLGGLWDCKDWAQYGYCDYDWLGVNWACVTTPPGKVKDHCKRSCNMCSK